MVSTQTYQSIQNWIARQLEYEAANSTPAPLTDAQRKLLEKLELSLPPETPPQPDPDLGDANWIGLLLEYRASRNRVTTGVPGGNFIEQPGPTVFGVQKWYCQVRIGEHSEPFPGPDGGLFPDGTQPSFARKKDAKKYAAKCAIEWLGINGYMPRLDTNGMKVRQPQEQQFTPQPSPARKKQKVASSSPEQPEGAATKSEPRRARTPPESPLPKGIASEFNSDEVSSTFEAQKLCNRLGYPGLPEFKITKNPESPDFYSGYPELGMLALRLPKDIGRVKDVYGKRAAKEKIAEELLVHLRELAAECDEKDRLFRAGKLQIKREVDPPTPA